MGSTVEKTGLFRLEGDTLITTELDGTGEDRLTRVTGNGSTSEAGSTDKAAVRAKPVITCHSMQSRVTRRVALISLTHCACFSSRVVGFN